MKGTYSAGRGRTTKPLIESKSVGKRFAKSRIQTEALRKVDLRVGDGEFVCLVGPSGCGKTTFLLMVAGLENLSSGEIRFNGSPVLGPSPERSYIFQDFALFPWLSIKKNVEFGLVSKGLPDQERDKVAKKYLDLVGLSGFENHYPHEISGGMKQRVAIARALAIEPKALLMDEPFGSLDAQTRLLMQQELLRIWSETKKTILFVTHSIIEAIILADRIYVMTARPGTVKKEVAVDLERPRDINKPGFARVHDEVRDALQEEVLRAVEMEKVKASRPFSDD